MRGSRGRPDSLAGGRWVSWAGLASATPRRVTAPASTEEVAELVRGAAAAGERVKMVGAGHSFTDVAVTDGWLLLPDRLTGVHELDRDAMTVTVAAGTPLHALNAALHRLGLSLHNMGDIDRQSVAGAVATGTHGSGGRWASLSAQVSRLEIVAADGSVQVADRQTDEELFRAAQVGLGAVGVVTAVTLLVETAFTLEADERSMPWRDVVDGYDALVAGNHHVDMYWFPHTEWVQVKRNNRTVDAPQPLSSTRRLLEDRLLANTVHGWMNRLGNAVPGAMPSLNRFAARHWGTRSYRDDAARVFVSPRETVFREMEYAVPREAGMAALADARRLIERAGWRIGFPVEVRTAPGDEAWLSTAYRRDSVYLAFHVDGRTDHRDYFRGVEQVMKGYDGRPHWGKLHTRTAADLAPAYPRWADFLAARDRVDPNRVFTNRYLDRVLGP